jgi:hypothetical protein
LISFKQFIEEKKDPCWNEYTQYGMKTKNGKEVPNCVPVKEATYQGREVPLNKPMKGDIKKSKVYVDPDGDGKATKVNFGDPNMRIKSYIPARRRSFRARHHCETPGPKDKARYWSCKAW